jgi:hypothetical protein
LLLSGIALLNAVPQSSQKADEGAFSEPHFGQRAANRRPHAEQNFLPVVLSVPHSEHRIILRKPNGSHVFYHQLQETDSYGISWEAAHLSF